MMDASGRVRLGVVALAIFAVSLIAACGSPAAVSPGESPTESSMTIVIESSTTIVIEQPQEATTTVVETADVKIGGVVLSLPPESRLSNRPAPQVPSLVLETHLWVLPNGTTLRMTLQNVEPNVGSESDDVLDSNGLTWKLYDIGPKNGTELAAIAKVPGGWLFVDLQQPGFDQTNAGWGELQGILKTAVV